MFLARPDGSGVRPLLPGTSGEPRQWSPDGTLLTVIPRNDPLVGSVVQADGTHQRVFRLPPGAPASLACGIWSPDANRLACEGFDDANPDRAPGVYTVNANDGQQLVRVTKHRDMPCSYSPDGTRILLVRVKAGDEEHNQLISVNVNGSNERLVTQTPVGLSCDWSPDGKTILSEMNGSLILIDSSGTPTLIAIPTAGSAGRGAFSPDGSHIIFAFAVGSRTDIYTARTDGSELTQITDTSADEEFPDWAR